MKIKYINISGEEYVKLSDKEKKEKAFFIEFFDGTKDYWIANNKLHREDGPSIVYSDGSKYWYLNGNYYSFKEWLEKTPLSNEEKIFLRLKYGN